MIVSIEKAARDASYDVWFIKQLCKDKRVAYAQNDSSFVVEFDDILYHKRQTQLKRYTPKQLNNVQRIKDVESIGFDAKFSGVAPVRKIAKSLKKVTY